MDLHKLSSVDLINKTAVCCVCGPTKIKLKGRFGRSCIQRIKEQHSRWRKTKGGKAVKKRYRKSRKEPHRKFLGPICVKCGFIPVDPCQLDVHHLDGNHTNNEQSNLQTLCANCHRLVHKLPVPSVRQFVSNLSGIIVVPEPQTNLKPILVRLPMLKGSGKLL